MLFAGPGNDGGEAAPPGTFPAAGGIDTPGANPAGTPLADREPRRGGRSAAAPDRPHGNRPLPGCAKKHRSPLSRDTGAAAGRTYPRSIGPGEARTGESTKRETNMDSTKFDAVARRMASGLSRREALRGLAAGAVVAAAGAVGLGVVSADAKKKPKRCKKAGARCTSNKQCCTGKTKRICEVPTGGSNSDTFCTGGTGAKCGGANEDGDAVGPVCSVNHRCSTGDIDDPDFVPNTPGVCLLDMDEF